jgi:hypothetical protein
MLCVAEVGCHVCEDLASTAKCASGDTAGTEMLALRLCERAIPRTLPGWLRPLSSKFV